MLVKQKICESQKFTYVIRNYLKNKIDNIYIELINNEFIFSIF